MLDAVELLWLCARRTLGTLTDPGVLRAMFVCMIGALGVCLFIGAYVYWDFSRMPLGHDPIDTVFRWIGRIVGIYAFFFLLYPAVMSLAFFAAFDAVADATERRWWPDAVGWRTSSVGEVLKLAMSFAWASILVGFVSVLLAHAVPGPHHLGLHLLLNGYVFGRMHWDWVAVRFLDPALPETVQGSLRARRAECRLEIALGGAVVSGLYLLPFVNLFAPVLGHVFMTHLYHAAEPKAKTLGSAGFGHGSCPGPGHDPFAPRGGHGLGGAGGGGFKGPILDAEAVEIEGGAEGGGNGNGTDDGSGNGDGNGSWRFPPRQEPRLFPKRPVSTSADED